MLTTDKVERAAAALSANQIPHPDDLREMMAAWKRMQSGLPYSAAIGETGAIAKRERDAAIVQIGERFGCGAWEAAELVRLQLQRPAVTEAHRDAAALGGRDLKRNALYLILSAAFKDRPGQTSVIATAETETCQTNPPVNS